ncbi:MAG TPA: sigma-70 family RNA polymerase sigma factor [Actinoplanes sp.]|nr:sigma-70 family RNA polymerase sigma factor [Actinoplanes sp.]
MTRHPTGAQHDTQAEPTVGDRIQPTGVHRDTPAEPAAGDRIAELHAAGWGRIVAVMIRFTGGNWDLAEECTQDAFTRALVTWPESGVPDQPLAWLTTTARRRAIDILRRAAVEREKLQTMALEADRHPGAWSQDRGGSHRGRASASQRGGDGMGGAVFEALDDAQIPDERLELVFTCCHPALGYEAQVALTLRSVVGLSTAEIARAFLVPEKTMGQRIFRAKQRIRHAGIPFRVPPPHLLPERLSAVLQVLYLLFNEGYGGDPLLGREAVRLGRVLVDLMPDEPEAMGALALMLIQDARRASRHDDAGDLVLLADQDRSLWDSARIAEGARLCERALRRGRAGPFQLQAAIAACHATAAGAADTDWDQIAGLYTVLRKVAPGPVVELNRAVAVSRTAAGPAAALRLVDAIEGLHGYHLFHATRADLLLRTGQDPGDAYRTAIRLAPAEAERRLLTERLHATRNEAGAPGASPRTGPRDGPPSGPPVAG